MTVNDIRTPAKFFHCFQYTACIENGTAIVIIIFYTIFIRCLHTILEIIIVIDEIYLHACGLDRSNFYNQGVVSIVDNQVHTREADHFVQLISALIDISPFRHKGSDFTAFFLYRLWKVSTYIGHFGF